MVPSSISGCPNCALSDAYIISHIIANSHPPPNCKRKINKVTQLYKSEPGPIHVSLSDPIFLHNFFSFSE